MKPKLLVLVLVGLLIALTLPVLPLNPVAAQDDRRGMRVQQGERRVALVIGNSAYKDSPLLNPVNDARAMAQALRGFGFEIVYGEDLSQNDMKRNIGAFGEKIKNGGVGLFYYAGHGMQVEGINYLIPVGATITSEEEVEYEAVDVGLVLAKMKAARNRLNFVILDACRDNPFARSFRSTRRGLATIYATGETLIAYATAPGSVASDGTGGNGLYTLELLKYIKMPELTVEQVFKEVAKAVRDKSQGKQEPWVLSSLTEDYYFSPAGAGSVAKKQNVSPSFDPATVELSFWESIKNSGDVEDYKAYLEKYPGGTFVALARNKIRGLEAAAKPSPTNITAPVEPKSGSAAGSLLPLKGFEFDTVAVNSSGSVTNRRKGQARYFVEDISGLPLEVVEIPGGTFLMGTGEKEAQQLAAEYKRYLGDNNKHVTDQWVSWQRPQHKVTVPTFYMGKYEVTQAQWRVVASLPKVNRDLAAGPSRFTGDNLPVEQVSWEDAFEFCERLSRATGRQYRLPTEAEWEYACHAGSTSQYAFGETITPELVNYNGNFPYGAATKGTYRQQTTPVGSLGVANLFGLFDIHGNVWEWCLDTWQENYNGAPMDGGVREGGDSRFRVLRGGSWGDLGFNCRAANRLPLAPDGRDNYGGFRVALSASTR